MARSEHLPIYKSSYDLCLYFEHVVRNFSRYHKYSLGSDLRDGARRVLKLVARANARRDKTRVLLGPWGRTTVTFWNHKRSPPFRR